MKNGELFVVKKIDKKNITLEAVNSRKKVKIPLERYKHIDYSYAITTHKSQGMTFNRVLVVDDGRANYNQFYVAITRGRYGCKVYTNDPVKTLFRAQFDEKKREMGKPLTRSAIAEEMIRANPELFSELKKHIDDFSKRRELRKLYHQHFENQLTGGKSAMDYFKEKQKELEELERRRKEQQKEEERRKQTLKEAEENHRKKREEERRKEEKKTALKSLMDKYRELQERKRQEQLEQERQRQLNQQKRNKGNFLSR